MLQRLFTVLAYKTKIMTANWIVAERLILPVRVVKVGDKDRPATDADLTDVQNQLSAVANDPNLTIVTHHAFDYEWYGATGKIHSITPELEEIGKEILDGLMLNQAILNGEMAGYSSAQVGIEVLIRRLDNWRNKLKEWVETNIFRPVAMMQGFIDEQESKESGETVYLFPKLTWNDLQLRDKTNRIQTLMQMYDKGMVSAQTVLEEMDLDYDSEVEKIREEQVMAQANGQVAGMGGGDAMAGAPMGGGPMGDMGGGMPGGDMGGGMPGGDMGGGAGGDMGGGMGGGAGGGMGGGAGGGMGGMGAAASGEMPMIGKRGSKKKQEQEEEEAPIMQPIKLTKLEGKMFRTLSNMDVPQSLFAQYQVKVPGEARPYAIDFAYPQIGVGIEVDGAIWHEREDFKQRDLQRDQKLANVGWRVLRFTEDAVNESMDSVRDTISQHIADASRSKKAAESEEMVKTSSAVEEWMNPLYEYCLSQGKIGCSRASVPHGQILYIGNIENGEIT
jgi:very-short-patch-repair endonuclease